MIPTLILAGLVLGRWWPWALVVAAIAWPAALVASNAMAFGWGLLGAAVLAVVNVLVGVLVHQAVARAIRRLRDGGRARQAGTRRSSR